MTQREFIPYLDALALKVLGFDEPCLGLYYEGGEFYPTSCTSHEQFYGQVCTAPLYQQAFRWLREKYGLSGLIEIGTQEFSFIVFDINKDSRKYTSTMNGTYEEAELACLKKAIKIINPYSTKEEVTNDGE